MVSSRGRLKYHDQCIRGRGFVQPSTATWASLGVLSLQEATPRRISGLGGSGNWAKRVPWHTRRRLNEAHVPKHVWRITCAPRLASTEARTSFSERQ